MSTAPAGDVHWGSGALSRRCRRRAPTSITTIASTSRSHPRRPDAPRQPAHHLSARRGLRRGDRRTRRAAQPLRLARTVRHGIARQTQGAAQAQGRMSGSARKTSSRTIEARRLAHSPRRQKSFNRDATVAESPRQSPRASPAICAGRHSPAPMLMKFWFSLQRPTKKQHLDARHMPRYVALHKM